MARMKPIQHYKGNKFSGVGYNKRPRPPKNPTYLPKKKVSPKDLGINVIGPCGT